MKVSLEWKGMDELMQSLKLLPEALVIEAGNIVTMTAQECTSQLRGAYPLGPTGNLKRGVSVKTTSSLAQVRATILSLAPHAHLYEFGTVQRVTKQGWARGFSKPHPTMIPLVNQAGRRLEARLISLVERMGLQVTKAA